MSTVWPDNVDVRHSPASNDEQPGNLVLHSIFSAPEERCYPEKLFHSVHGARFYFRRRTRDRDELNGGSKADRGFEWRDFSFIYFFLWSRLWFLPRTLGLLSFAERKSPVFLPMRSRGNKFIKGIISIAKKPIPNHNVITRDVLSKLICWTNLRNAWTKVYTVCLFWCLAVQHAVKLTVDVHWSC